ncbi:antibiotic biosynthesis monooxygenase [Catenovulum sp. 2E275]|uniref:putative quinol monooxygenase n=1 Tax=Catenovulum sp. 2E275 TaxID=2980497 RepID=UPI0021CE564C|nr:putative quinol monooxygenase [Catenovulum sp. 2E275]MCU4674334.1 antibiotic biosynthesis monooxygenase [Catenovulum sp. 2E275]
MYIVTVEFVIHSAYLLPFLDAALENADSSLHHEEACHQFEVSQSHETPTHFFFYESYDDEQAFQQHLESQHFLTFSNAVKNWVISKKVRCWYAC